MIHVATTQDIPAQSSRSRIPAGAVPVSGDILVDTRERRQRARRLDALVNELSGKGATAILRLGILRHLDQFGPRLVRELPREWPITRQHVRRLANRLIDDGLLAFTRNGDSGSPRRLDVTEEGRRVLEEIDWNETLRRADEETTAG